MALLARSPKVCGQLHTSRTSASSLLLRSCPVSGAFQHSIGGGAFLGQQRNASLARRTTTTQATASIPPRSPTGPPTGPPGQAPRKPSNNSKVGSVPIQGQITQNLSNGKFRVKLINGVTVIAHLSGKIRKNKIKIAVGDDVTVELSAYDLTRGRISFRH